MVCDNTKRYSRLRWFIKKLNKERKKQAQKIDILCNDLIAAHRRFIEKLNTISFTAYFYESLLGSTDLEDLLHTAAGMIKAESEDTNVTFFLRHEDDPSIELRAGFELHIFESNQPVTFEESFSIDDTPEKLENCFSPELMNSICKSNKVCTLNDMFAMGLEGNLAGLNRVWAVTIPLGLSPHHSRKSGSLAGFILIYRPAEKKLTTDEIEKIRAITSGLSRAIASCLTLSRER